MSELLRLPKDAIPMVSSAKKRDLTIYTMVSFNPTTMGVEIVGAKEEEICSFNAEWKAHQLPIPEHYIRRAFDELYESALEKMRRAGVVR
jgi:hypothetical protein